MSKVTLAVFCLVTVLLSCTTSFSSPVPDDCPAAEITVYSFGISSDVVVVNHGLKRHAGRVEVDPFFFTQGEWHPIGGTIIGTDGFGWKSDEIGRYKFVVRREGFKAATLIVDVRSLKGMWNVFIVPLKADGCARARLIRVER